MSKLYGKTKIEELGIDFGECFTPFCSLGEYRKHDCNTEEVCSECSSRSKCDKIQESPEIGSLTEKMYPWGKLALYSKKYGMLYFKLNIDAVVDIKELVNNEDYFKFIPILVEEKTYKEQQYNSVPTDSVFYRVEKVGISRVKDSCDFDNTIILIPKTKYSPPIIKGDIGEILNWYNLFKKIPTIITNQRSFYKKYKGKNMYAYLELIK